MIVISWLNLWGLALIAVIMVPNILFAVKCKEGFVNLWHNRLVEVAEQIGRYGCFTFMIINIPGTFFYSQSKGMFTIYLVTNIVLTLAYCTIWIICFRQNSVFKALALSVIPSLIFTFSGILTGSVLLIISSLIFAPSHITLSYKNAKAYGQKIKEKK